MTVKERVLRELIISICNPFHLTDGENAYLMYVREVLSMIEELNDDVTVNQFESAVLNAIQGEIELVIDGIKEKNPSIRKHWDRIEKMMKYFDIVCDDKKSVMDWKNAADSATVIGIFG